MNHLEQLQQEIDIFEYDINIAEMQLENYKEFYYKSPLSWVLIAIADLTYERNQMLVDCNRLKAELKSLSIVDSELTFDMSNNYGMKIGS